MTSAWTQPSASTSSTVMTQDDLAAAAEVSTDLIRKLEQGRQH
jgi:predicted transcriptional regulator